MWKEESLEASEDNISSAIKYINSLKTNGGSNIQAALEKTFNSSNDIYSIYLLADSIPNSGIQKPENLAKFIENLQKN